MQAKAMCYGGPYAKGGEVDGDSESLMDHCALELMHAIESKDKSAMLDAFHVLVADVLNKMSSDDDQGDSDVNG